MAILWRSRRLFLLCLLTLVFASACRGSSGERGLSPGQRPPVSEYETLDGQPFDLDSLKGKVLLLNFWASWCAPCVVEMPALQALHDALEPKGFSVVAIGIDDSAENLAKVQKRFNLTFPIVRDRKGAAKPAFRLVGFPESFLVGRDGNFIMFPDPDSGEPVVRVIGPREWNREPALGSLRAIVEAQ